MWGSKNQSFERMDARDHIDAQLAEEGAIWSGLNQMVDEAALSPEEAEQAIADYHRVFIGTYMGETSVADSVWKSIV